MIDCDLLMVLSQLIIGNYMVVQLNQNTNLRMFSTTSALQSTSITLNGIRDYRRVIVIHLCVHLFLIRRMAPMSTS